MKLNKEQQKKLRNISFKNTISMIITVNVTTLFIAYLALVYLELSIKAVNVLAILNLFYWFILFNMKTYKEIKAIIEKESIKDESNETKN